MKKAALFLLLTIASNLLPAQQLLLSDEAQISILTVAPGVQLNDAFGHNAFRIKDDVNNLDIIFDYGRFDFNTPNFYLNFARGKLNYSIGTSNFNRFLRVYAYQNRTIKEQVLNVSQNQKQKLYNFLIENNQPENRFYLYDFFFDNCATKMKDVLKIVLGNDISFEKPKDIKPQTFRTLIQDHLNWNSWGSLGIDVALGSVIDTTPKTEDYMFLPENIYRFFEVATLNNNEPLIEDSSLIFVQKDRVHSSSFFVSPLFILGFISLIFTLITFKDFKQRKRTKWLDVLLFSVTGIIGLCVLLLWFATDHSATKHNYNLLWACVLNIFIISQVFKNQANKWFIQYLKFLIILLCLLCLHWIIGVQVFAKGLLPVIILLFVRYLFLIQYFSRVKKNNTI